MEFPEREQAILTMLAEKGGVTVADLSQSLEVSEVTIRSDLTSMEEQGLLNRVHGGAVPSIHPHIFERQRLFIEEKQRIAKAAADLVCEGDTIMIEAGTTTALVARYLVGKKHVHIVTNSMLAFTAARTNPYTKITIVGGEFRKSTESFVGSIAADAIRRFNVKYAFVGTDGFSAKVGITTHLMEGGDIIKAMKERAEQMILLADSSKYNKAGVVTILPLSSIDTIITDKAICKEALAEIKEHNVRVIIN